MRNLATVQNITNISPIPGADSIEVADVLGWQVVVKKGEFKTGDKVVYCEVDSVMPDKPEFEFLRERKFRIKTIRLRGQISQGICFPMSILQKDMPVGTDVTDRLGVIKWEPYKEDPVLRNSGQKIRYPDWVPQWLQNILHRSKILQWFFKKTSGAKSFPSIIPKTDETRVQVLQPLLNAKAGVACYVTEKLDGSSITIYNWKGKVGVCSRKLELPLKDSNKFSRTVRELGLDKKIPEGYAFQGELIGPSVQGNKYNLSELDIYIYNAFKIKAGEYLGFEEFQSVVSGAGFKIVPTLNNNYTLGTEIPELVKLATGQSVLNPTVPREGIVIRPLTEEIVNDLHVAVHRGRFSFKVINPEFELKYNQ